MRGALSVSDSILATIRHAIAQRSDWAHIQLGPDQNVHIAIMSEPYLSHIFSNKKTLESRFTMNKISPYNNAKIGDIVFVKHGPIVGYFIVHWVKFFDLTEYPIDLVAREYSHAICVDEEFWRKNKDKRYATLLGVFDVHDLSPVDIQKRDQRGWVTIKN